MLGKRQVVQKNLTVSDKELYKLGVIATLKESLFEERRLNRVWKDEFYRFEAQ